MMKAGIVVIVLLFSAGTCPAEQLTLSEALLMRASYSPTLKMANLDQQIAAESVSITRSGYLPRIDIQGGYTAQQAPQSITVQQGSFETQQADYPFLSLGIYQTLYDFGRTHSRSARATANREATANVAQSLRQDVFLQTVAAYFRILQESKLLQAAEEEVTQMTGHLRIARNLFEQGVVTRNDLLQAEVRLASSRHRRIEIANRLENSWLDLNNQIGDPPDSRKELVEETKVEVNDLLLPPNEAVSRRGEILAQRKLLDAGEAEVREARTGYFPEIYGKLGLDYVQNDKVKEQAIMAATVGLRINLFDGFATTSRYRQAIEKRAQIEERLHQMESDLALEYRVAMNDAKVAKERIALTEASIQQGEENLRINKDRYEAQVGTATDVIDAQTLLTQMKTDHFQAIFDLEVALARVKRSRGEL